MRLPMEGVCRHTNSHTRSDMNFSSVLSGSAASKVSAFLSSRPPYFGASAKEQSGTVKSAGGKWNPDKKSWYAPDLKTAFELLKTDAWVPFHPGSRALPFKAGAELAKLRKDMHARFGGRPGPPATDEAARAQRPKEVLETAEQTRKRMRRELQVEDDEPIFLEGICPHLTPEELEASSLVAELGPRSGLSNARRVHRGVVFLKLLDWEELRQKIRAVARPAAAAQEDPPTKRQATQKRGQKQEKGAVEGPACQLPGTRGSSEPKGPRTTPRHLGHIQIKCARCHGMMDTAAQFVSCSCDEWVVCSQCCRFVRSFDSGCLSKAQEWARCACRAR